MRTPSILEPAIRQYQHNDCSGFVAAFDHNETAKIVNLMTSTIKAQSMLLVKYRTGGQPPEWVFDVLKKARAFGIEAV